MSEKQKQLKSVRSPLLLLPPRRQWTERSSKLTDDHRGELQSEGHQGVSFIIHISALAQRSSLGSPSCAASLLALSTDLCDGQQWYQTPNPMIPIHMINSTL
jgi:hypothetical protein